MKYIIHTDGGSRGNPGQAAIGVIINSQSGDTKQNTIAFGKRIGITTNNVAEYTAVIEALRWVIETKKQDTALTDGGCECRIQFYLDSTLVVNQLNGLFKVKDANMRMLMLQVRELEQMVEGTITYSYIPREQNADADFQVNKALDGS